MNFKLHTSRKEFDRKGKMNNLYASQFLLNQPLLEEFWLNLEDQCQVRRRGYERLTIHQMKDFGVKEEIPEDTSNDGITLDPCYEMDRVATKDLEPINWMEKDETNIHNIS